MVMRMKVMKLFVQLALTFDLVALTQEGSPTKVLVWLNILYISVEDYFVSDFIFCIDFTLKYLLQSKIIDFFHILPFLWHPFKGDDIMFLILYLFLCWLYKAYHTLHCNVKMSHLKVSIFYAEIHFWTFNVYEDYLK